MQVLRAAALFDGSRFVERPAVAIEGGRIAAVGASVPPGADALDLGDVTLLPGLVDCHQHLCFNGQGALEEQVTGTDDGALRERARAAGRAALAAGVTTVRDLGDRGYVTLDLRGEPGLPTVLASGPPITRSRGHCWYLGGECAEDEDGLRRAVDERAERGVDVVKIMVSGGFSTPTYPVWENQFTGAQLRVVVDAAHGRGIPVAAHCHASSAIGDALDAGVDTIEHCTFFTASGRAEPDEDLMARLAAGRTVVSATVGVLPDAAPPPPVVAASMDNILRAIGRLHHLGATIVGGTDAGIVPGKPHGVLPHALGQLVGTGMSPVEGLRALTSAAAAAVGLGDRKGRLAPGFDADVLAVTGDPRRDASALAAAAGVWRAGERVA